jgi:hypothetical protein
MITLDRSAAKTRKCNNAIENESGNSAVDVSVPNDLDSCVVSSII